MPGGTKTRLFLIVVFAFYATTMAQGVTFLHSLTLGSEGNGKLKVSFNESDLARIHGALVEALGIRPKTQSVLSASKPGGESLFKRFASVHSSADSNDLFVGICVAGWEANREAFSLAGMHADSVTAEYLLHFLQFLPTRDAVLFLLCPSKADYPVDIIVTTGTAGGGGKYLVTVKTQERTTFANLVEEFLDAMEHAKGKRESDVNKDSYLTFSEWLEELSNLCAGKKVSLFPYKINDADDQKIKQLK